MPCTCRTWSRPRPLTGRSLPWDLILHPTINRYIMTITLIRPDGSPMPVTLRRPISFGSRAAFRKANAIKWGVYARLVTENEPLFAHLRRPEKMEAIARLQAEIAGLNEADPRHAEATLELLDCVNEPLPTHLIESNWSFDDHWGRAMDCFTRRIAREYIDRFALPAQDQDLIDSDIDGAFWLIQDAALIEGIVARFHDGRNAAGSEDRFDVSGVGDREPEPVAETTG